MTTGRFVRADRCRKICPFFEGPVFPGWTPRSSGVMITQRRRKGDRPTAWSRSNSEGRNIMSKLILLLNIGLIAHLGGCGDDGSQGDPADPEKFTAPTGEELAFGVKEGNIRNYFHRQGPTAVHLL